METPQGRYWNSVVGKNPAPEDETFVDHRTMFISELVEFNELKEARLLRGALIENMASGGDRPAGVPFSLDLKPEVVALNGCLAKLHKKLKL